MDEILRYTDTPNAVKLALSAGMSSRQIVRLLTGGRTYEDARKIATDAAPLLGITVTEFMRLRRNG
jgi:hypothetical protein